MPAARGRSRSLPLETVLKELRRLGQAGYQEIVLTGIHLGAYGRDLPGSICLLDMLIAVERERPVPRIRLSSLEPAEVTDELIYWLSGSDVVCPHFHVPLQSGDDDVLKAMRRTYDRSFFSELIEKIRFKVPRAGIGVDVMTGFPGEDEAAFQNTFDMIASLPLTYLHVFPYSRRPGTTAAVMQGQVAEKTKKERAETLRSLGAKKKREFARSFVGSELPVLIEGYEGRDKKSMQGWTDNYLTMILEQGSPDWVNHVVSVRVMDEKDGQLWGRITHA